MEFTLRKFISVTKYVVKMQFLGPRYHLGIPIAREFEIEMTETHWEEEEPSITQYRENV